LSAGDIKIYRINNASGPTFDLGILINGIGAVKGQFQASSYGAENLFYLSDNSPVNLKAMSITTPRNGWK